MNKREIEKFASICTKIDDISEDLKQIRNHLEKLNGQVATNTHFRARATVILSILSFVSGGVLLASISWVITHVL